MNISFVLTLASHIKEETTFDYLHCLRTNNRNGYIFERHPRLYIIYLI